MRVKVVRTFLVCSVLLAGKSHSQHNGNSPSKCQCKAVLFLTSISVITGGGDKIRKYIAQNHSKVPD